MGQGKFTSAPIDESIGLLNRINKSALDAIRSKHPEFSSILEQGVIGGEKEINNDELTVRAEVCKVALEETLNQSKNKYLPHLQNKLKKLQKIELWSQIIIVVSSSTVFGLLTQDLGNSGFLFTAYIAAGLSLIGAILTIILKQNSGEWSNNNQNIASSYTSLVNFRIKAEELFREINILTQFTENNSEKLSVVINDCNDVNREIRIIIDKYILK